MATETQQSMFRKPSIFRRFSKRERNGDAPLSPYLLDDRPRSPRKLQRRPVETAPLSPPLPDDRPRTPRKLQRRTVETIAGLPTPPASPKQNVVIAIDASQPHQPKMLAHAHPPKMMAHVQYVQLPRHQPVRNEHGTPPLSPEPRGRVLPNAIPRLPFPGQPLITPWEIFLPPSQIYSLYLGIMPKDMTDKWYIFSEGPDQAGKLKVHFHRSWTGMKVAELFVVMDTKGEGAGKVVGIKWNSGEEMNWMSEEEAKYMIRTACKWQLAVDLEN